MSRSLLAGAAVLLAVAINQPTVHAVNEPRPYTRLPHALVLVHRSVDASFPSDHATMAGAAAVGLLLVHRRLGLVSSRSLSSGWAHLCSPAYCGRSKGRGLDLV